MSTRTSFRPRPLDTLRQLNIVRDVKELDDGEQKVSRDIVHSHEALDKDNEEVNETCKFRKQCNALPCRTAVLAGLHRFGQLEALSTHHVVVVGCK